MAKDESELRDSHRKQVCKEIQLLIKSVKQEWPRKMSLCFSHFPDHISLCLEVKKQISGYCKLIFN